MPLRPLLTKEEELKLIKKAQKGDTEAENSLMWHNEGFIISMVKKFTCGYSANFDIDDYIQEGRLGYLEAIRKFKAKKKCRLSTYASWHIRKRLHRYFSEKSRTIRIPNHKVERINEVIRKSRLMNNREANINDFSRALKTKDFFSAYSIMSIFYGTSPLTFDFMAVHRDPEYKDLDKIKEFILENTDIQPDRLEIVFKFFGVFGYEQKDMEEIGKELGIPGMSARDRMNRTLWRISKFFKEKNIKYGDFLDK